MGTKIVEAKRIPATIQAITMKIFFANESVVGEVTFKSWISVSSSSDGFVSGSVGSIWIVVGSLCWA